MEYITFGIEMIAGLIIFFGFLIYSALTDKDEKPDPKTERIRQWKRNKKKWAKHKFES